jgi:KipI family sensor histidine kinase inhibitor
MRYDGPRFLDQGETALTVEFGDCVDEALNAQVLALDAALRADPPVGLRETTPTYRSLMLYYEPLEITRAALVEAVARRLAEPGPAATSAASGRRWTIPCCYDPAFAEDIAEAAAALALDPSTLAGLHAGADYRAFMYGFSPGWCYLGGLPAALALPRRAAPRGPTPPGAVLIGGGLSLIAARPMPTGWYVIGRTPERLFTPTRPDAFLIAPGDRLRFEAVDCAAFAMLDARAAKNEIVAHSQAGV